LETVCPSSDAEKHQQIRNVLYNDTISYDSERTNVTLRRLRVTTAAVEKE
jgi:hypothetical protein